jgi:hypothetical protein
MVKEIVTHPGGAHKDEFLACSLMVAKYRVPVFRREPTSSDLADPRVCVIDVGGIYDEVAMNFDHHQFPRDHPPACALTLVLKHLNLYDDAKLFCDWLETAEWMDTRGPLDTSEWLGIDRIIMAKLNSPIDMTVLRRFAMGYSFTRGDVIWLLMAMVGEDMMSFILSTREKLDFLRRYVSFHQIVAGRREELAFLPRVEGVPDDISAGMLRYILMLDKPEVVALVYPDRRGGGYGLSRMNDAKCMEYTKIKFEEDVHFAHNRGFIAKTSATEQKRLFELVEKSLVFDHSS